MKYIANHKTNNVQVKKIVFGIVLLTMFIHGFSQEKNFSAKESYLEAESDLLYEEYSEALPLYLKLYKQDTSNYNFCFKVGLCYLNVPYEKQYSIKYLEKAVNNISKDYKSNSVKEKQAPVDAIFYLGNAYRVNNQLDKALDKYYQFKKLLDPEVFDEELVNDQIKSIERAKKYEKNPIYFDAKNIGEPINSKFAQTNAVVSADENTMVYNVKLQFYDALYFSKKENGKWGEPVNIIPDLGVDGDVYATGISGDGKELFIYRNDNYDGNLYVTRFANGKWTPIKKLNDNINTKFWESHASVSPDGKTLYFTSNRAGGFGGLDIYTATRTNVAQDNWTNVRNIGPEINTPFNEETPFISQDGQLLFFSSYGHFNMGGYDIFYSTLLSDGKWSVPLNMGYPLNTPDDDLFFAPEQNGQFGYMCRYYPNKGNFGKTDVYRVEVFTSQHPRKFILKGMVSLPTDFKVESLIIAKIVNKSTRDTILRVNVNKQTGQFDANLAAGDYQVITEGEGLSKSVENISINGNQENNEVAVNTTLKVKSIEKETVKNSIVESKIKPISFDKSFFKVTNGSEIAIPLYLDKDSKVTVDISLDSAFKKKDKFKIKSNPQDYKFTPVPGKNVLKFSSVSPTGDKSDGEVVIFYDNSDELLSEGEQAQRLSDKQMQANYIKSLLEAQASGNLKSEIAGIDVIGENLTSLDELGSFLKNKAKTGNYQPSEVDSLIKKYNTNQPKAASLLVNGFEAISDSIARLYIDSLKISNDKNSVAEVINYLLNHSKSDSVGRKQLLKASSRLANLGDAYYYLLALRKVTSGNLKGLLDSLNLTKEHIKSPDELLDYLLNKSAKANYTQDDVYKAFLVIPTFTKSPVELLNALKDLSDGKMKDFLSSINLDKENVKTTSDLGLVLFEKAKSSGIPLKDLIKLYFKANSKAYFKQLLKDIETFASGRLKKTLDGIDWKSKNINSVNELLDLLLKSQHDYDFTRDLFQLFSYIASKNLMNADDFNPTQSKGFFNNMLTVGLTSALAILLILFFIFIFRKKRKNKER